MTLFCGLTLVVLGCFSLWRAHFYYGMRRVWKEEIREYTEMNFPIYIAESSKHLSFVNSCMWTWLVIASAAFYFGVRLATHI